MGFFIPLLMTIGTGLSAFSSYSQGKAMSKAAKAQADAEIRRAEEEKLLTELEEMRLRKDARKFMSTQRALYGKAGVTFEGSPIEVMAETAYEAEFDAQILRHGGEVRATAYEERARALRGAAGGYRAAGLLKAGTSLLTGASSIYQRWPKSTPQPPT
jgi:hypothetical protein